MDHYLLDYIDPIGDLRSELEDDALKEAQPPIYHVLKDSKGKVAVAALFRDVGVPLVWEVHMYANPYAMRWLTVGAMMVLLQVPAWRSHAPWGAYAIIPWEKKGLYRAARALPFVQHRDTGIKSTSLTWSPQDIDAVDPSLVTCRVVDIERRKV